MGSDSSRQPSVNTLADKWQSISQCHLGSGPPGTLRVTASLFLTCHYLPAAVDSGLHCNLPWQIQNEGSAAWLVRFPGLGKSDRQPTPQGHSLNLKTTIKLNYGGSPICKHLHLQSFWCWYSLSAEIKKHMNYRKGNYCLRHPWQILKTTEIPVNNYFPFLLIINEARKLYPVL